MQAASAARAMLDAGNVVDAANYDAAMAAIEVRWRQSIKTDVRIGFLDKVDASYCRCLLDYAAVTARDWLAQE